MTDSTASPLRVGAWRVDPRLGEISRDGRSLRMETRSMRLLMHLAAHAGEVVSIDDLLEQVWTGVIVTPDSVYQAVTSLRRALGDDAKKPAYIATVPRLGYRMIAAVEPWTDDVREVAEPPAPRAGRGRRIRAVAAVLLLTAGVAGVFAWRAHLPAQATAAPLSIAVLPFLDLTTQAMDEEYFADGMTEEIINHLSTLPGVHVPGATASFYYKDKAVPVADIGRALGVDYVLDGSVRKSDDTLRIAVRLLRASDGYVVWAQSFDRPRGSVLAVQKDVADEIARSLRTTLAPAPAQPDDHH
jgi:TolB-like protein/DNA-binding winged helix-turn-helix (wHTH) protein